jgi:hypothetical protein
MTTVVEACVEVDRGYRVVDRGLVFTRALLPDEWRTIGRQLARVHQRTLWALGDWLNAGRVSRPLKPAPGEEDCEADYQYARQITGRSYESISQIARVSRAFPIERRDVPLTWSFYREALRLPDAERHHALKMAAFNHWTRDDLADYISAATNGATCAPQPPLEADDERVASSDRPRRRRRARNHHLITCPKCGHRFTR